MERDGSLEARSGIEVREDDTKFGDVVKPEGIEVLPEKRLTVHPPELELDCIFCPFSRISDCVIVGSREKGEVFNLCQSCLNDLTKVESNVEDYDTTEHYQTNEKSGAVKMGKTQTGPKF